MRGPEGNLTSVGRKGRFARVACQLTRHIDHIVPIDPADENVAGAVDIAAIGYGSGVGREARLCFDAALRRQLGDRSVESTRKRRTAGRQ